MRRQIGLGITSIAFLVVIPTVISLMLPNGINLTLGWLLIAASMAVGLGAGAIAIGPSLNIIVLPTWQVRFSRGVPFQVLTPMKSAAKRALRLLENTHWAAAAKDHSGFVSTGSAESYMASLLVGEGAMPVYGRPDRYSKMRLIEPHEHHHVPVSEDCTAFCSSGEKPRFVEIAVARRDLRKRLNQMKGS